jgi:hypothetical protein
MSKNDPILHPAPGRCIIRLVPRFIKFPGTNIDLDGAYQYQPMVGQLVAVGDPRTDDEKCLADWATGEAEANRLFIFSAWGSGVDMYTNEMAAMKQYGYDFEWLKGYRNFDIGQLGMTVSNSGTYGERLASAEETN